MLTKRTKVVLLSLSLLTLLAFRPLAFTAESSLDVPSLPAVAADSQDTEPEAVAKKVNVLAPFFEKLKDKGFPVAARAFRDGSAWVDVYDSGVVLRYTFSKKGKLSNAASPDKYSSTSLRRALFSASDAAKAAFGKLRREQAQVRAVMYMSQPPPGDYRVAVYDSQARFLGTYRYQVADGRLDGWADGVGERDPIRTEEEKSTAG